MKATGKKKRGKSDLSGQERRRHTRFQVYQNSMLCNGDSLAEILDISSGGLACRSVVDGQRAASVLQDVEILNCELGEYVQGLSCRRVRTEERSANGTSADCFFEFVGVSENQADKLNRFIKSSIHGPAPRLLFS